VTETVKHLETSFTRSV